MNSISIQGVGAVTALGLDAERTVASLRSGLDAFGKLPYWGESEKDLQVARIKGFAEGVFGVRRYEALAMRALVPALGDLPVDRRSHVVLFLGLPRVTRPGVPAKLAQHLVPTLARRLGLPLANVRPIAAGRASAFLGLQEAASLCPRGYDCLVGGVDCLVNPASLTGLSKAHLLKEEWDGFIPGEAAAFVRLSSQRADGPWGPTASLVAGIGSSTERADGTAEHPLVGAGVSQAFRAAASGAGITDADVDLCINDVNGARAAFEDESYGWVRFFRSQRADDFLEVLHTASYVGEVGAAVGGLSLVWGSATLDLGFRAAKHLLLSASDGDARTAVVLRAGSRRGGSEANRSLAEFEVGTGALVLHRPERAARATVEDDVGLKVAGIDLGNRGFLAENLSALGSLFAVIKSHHETGSDPWQDLASFEDRFIAHADALGWGGDDARAIADRQLASDEPDEAAAAALVIMSFPHEASVRAAIVDAARKSADHAAWIQEGCLHAPPSTAGPLLWSMLEDPTLAPGALDTARAAGMLRLEHLDAWLQRRDPAFGRAMIRAYGWLGARDRWPAVADLLTGQEGPWDTETLLAALATSPNGRDVFERVGVRTFAESPIAWTFHCLRSGHEVTPHVGSIGLEPPLPVIEALGWSGESGAQGLLLGALQHESEPVRVAAARSLRRIYGHSPEERVDVPDENNPAGKVRVRRLAENADTWRPLLAQTHRPMRYGRAMNPRSAIETLSRPENGTRERTLAAWEHVLRTGARPSFHPRQLVRRQRSELLKLGAAPV